MRRQALCCMLTSVAVLTPSLASSQQPKGGPDATANPLLGGQYFLYSLVSGYIVKAADEMPEANYSFRPTPEVRTYGQLIGHLADASYLFCSGAKGEKNPNQKEIEKTVTAKADLIKALNDGLTYCNGVYTALKDSQLGDKLDFFGHPVSRLTILSFNTAHDDEHYGNIVTYLRIKGLVPPSSQRSANAG